SKAVKINSDTVETYTALGNLFRSKGEVARAIRIHQSIILRPNIDHKTKVQASYDLGLDYKKAGFVNKAIESFEEVVKIEKRHLEAHVQLVGLYEDTVEWEKAYHTQTLLSKIKKSDDSHVLAHHQVELGKILSANGMESQAKKAYTKAISLNRNCVDAYLHYGDLLFSEGAYPKAITQWKKMMELAPNFTYLAYPRLEDAYFKLNKFDQMEVVLRENSKKNYHDIHTHLALAEYLYKKSMFAEAIGELKTVLELDPSHLGAGRKMGQYLLEQGRESEAVAVYQDLFDKSPLPENYFQCRECGYDSRELHWRCPQCHSWDSISGKTVSLEKA
ncbi:MAG: tetratricopeptide repeat protein, partial [Proteobacteria bacterium]|nr:tetratricopeptide repeat protein [Pseudomonadota bacterium]